MTFKNSKDVIKYAYELSEILYYSVKRGWLDAAKIKAAYEYIKSIADTDTLEMRQDMQINRTQARVDMVNGMPFFRMTVCHPMLVHRFGEYEICAEVVTKEKQYAAGTQPMLYVCLPITTLTFKNNIIGRTLDKKETADWVIRNEEAELSLELFRIFGMLSPNHRFDVLAIFEMLFPDLER